jgi:iron complex outermembrane recepter protein
LQWSATAFLNRSPFGATITRDPVTFSIFTVRAPETVRGAEFTLDWSISRQWRTGGSLSHQEGERRLNGVTEALPGTRIAPLKLSAFVRRELGPRSALQLDWLHSGERDKFANGAVNAVFSANVVGGDAEGAGKVRAVNLFSLSYTQPMLGGDLNASVNNLLNSRYVPPTLQALNDPRAYYNGQGRALGLSWRRNW